MKSVNVSVVVVLIFFVSCCIVEVRGDLKITGTKCGTKICKTQDYCSAFDNQCYPCSNICSEKTHNYDAIICTRDCQEYIHDSRYLRREDGSTQFSGNEDLRATVQRLQYTVTVTLTLLCVVIIILIIIATIQIFKWKKSNNVTFSSLREKFCLKKSSSPTKSAASNGVSSRQVGGKLADLRLDMPSPGVAHSDHSPVTMTTSISRRPAEDSALDYAYDNRAMANTPSPR